jgi:hypothetical protein
VELSEKRRLNPIARFVARPEAVSKRLNDVIRRNADVHGATFDHFQHRVEHADDRTIGSILALAEATETVEVPEQLVGPVYNVNDHLGYSAVRVAALNPPILLWLPQ